jgi:hypothetical protein
MRSTLSRRAFLTGLAAGSLATSRSGSLQASLDPKRQPLPPVRAITRGPRFHWRGYYDKLLFDPTDRFVLANEVDFEGRSPRASDEIDVGMIDTHDGDRWIKLGRTSAWNWQQGCMLQFAPGSANEVVWNDRDGHTFVSRVFDLKTSRTRTLPHPIYCLTPDGSTAFLTDFRRLNDCRPGYGYAGIPDPNAKVLAPEDVGIWKMDMKSGQRELIFSIHQAARIPHTGRPSAAFGPEAKHWFNHLLSSPDGRRLFFLHRWRGPKDGGSFRTRAFTINTDGADPFILDPHGGTSHFVWRDPKHVFAFAWHPSHGDRFYLYEDGTDHVQVIGKDAMPVNGHHTYISGTENTWVLNDTYPDAKGLQHPYLYHISTNRRVPLGHFPSPPAYRGEWRCDNHPAASRDGTKVVFDSAHAGGRQVYLVDIAEIVHKTG